MLTEDKILEHANLLLEKRTLTPAEYHGWVSGAIWAMRECEEEIDQLVEDKKYLGITISNAAEWSAKQTKEIADLADCLKCLKDSLETMHKDAKAINKSFKLLPAERAAIDKANELLKKYEK